MSLANFRSLSCDCARPLIRKQNAPITHRFTPTSNLLSFEQDTR
nr:MAG TPA_asm: hypothetical protein [Bacteriophage sp.]